MGGAGWYCGPAGCFGCMPAIARNTQLSGNHSWMFDSLGWVGVWTDTLVWRTIFFASRDIFWDMLFVGVDTLGA